MAEVEYVCYRHLTCTSVDDLGAVCIKQGQQNQSPLQIQTYCQYGVSADEMRFILVAL